MDRRTPSWNAGDTSCKPLGPDQLARNWSSKLADLLMLLRCFRLVPASTGGVCRAQAMRAVPRLRIVGVDRTAPALPRYLRRRQTPRPGTYPVLQ